jgi:hypothetical protein
MSNHLTQYQFQKGQPSPHPEGRPKALKNILKTDFGITQSQCNEIILSMLAMTKTQIEQESNNPDSPMFTRIIGKAMLKSLNNSSLYALESLLNRSIGMPRQQTDLRTTTEQPIFVSLNLDVE